MAVVTVNNNNFNEEVINTKGLVLADFNANWCGPCRMLKPIVEELSEERNDCKIVSINIDDEEALADKYGVSSIPCLVLFKDGKEIKRTVGFQPKEELIKFMED